MKKEISVDLPEGKLGLFWIMGALAFTLSAWIIGHSGAQSPLTFIAFLLMLFSGLAWIGVSVGVAHHNKTNK
ncbi:MAG: hypothetical protein K0B02_04250 [DPANN group archaeon]|nr:hypothetical protein [DPANN group archaeon]